MRKSMTSPALMSLTASSGTSSPCSFRKLKTPMFVGGEGFLRKLPAYDPSEKKLPILGYASSELGRCFPIRRGKIDLSLLID
eukprot:CAMPEP_0206276138 /NCGR_PEP_ID=MMETSP0047_2-20121206/36137_1 /ASSEMBLY_ACC=CAM_ASM_000192 /TAXON_ID=195065 /ORGANISM="Chroomonas mesostigmatica_cf, Strain CCMP1168" /LENGTH=81 /DNA_ID=CAMNT_0053705617 /DNA_START=35 /DNA_END=280 /DNA_ORIENTATION=-